MSRINSNDFVCEIKAKIAKIREKSPTESVKKQARTPHLFTQIRQPESGSCLLIPAHSSENRDYIPFEFVNADEVIIGNACNFIPNASLLTLGIMLSSAHNIWTKTVCGRLTSRIRYSPFIYNNFPWIPLKESHIKKIEESAQKILDIRESIGTSLAKMYDSMAMDENLLKAHQENDRNVLRAYGISTKISEPEIFEELRKLWEKDHKD